MISSVRFHSWFQWQHMVTEVYYLNVVVTVKRLMNFGVFKESHNEKLLLCGISKFSTELLTERFLSLRNAINFFEMTTKQNGHKKFSFSKMYKNA